ncbi:glycoside hydrolase family 13 protein [Thermosediminibacter oceani]|uniref:Alpha amylase catalytic region n=1 Tax=Thermosediminibacter oceani (strain ATCC BAA-1034 / DSM 16646 / JW/IW-1228P) TaxID=555079 RepID=D9RYQ2_THEOJ|nr:alpha-glucosidase [Thermosediminibacter oceani]ADL08476.1 alpha amylase catalytic region [Thermosediminibacter oceani DSM 16646]
MNRKWWKEAVVYQIYPRSFYDSNGDGIGDLRGIIQKLDYLKELGVDAIWLNPVYKSPNADNGYDVSDYYDIMDEFGTMADFDELLQEAHRRGMKLIMDLVVNHTSDEHKWFIESRSSKHSPYRDYYIWREGQNGREPNNWVSIFGGPAWEYDERTGEYYLHLFAVKQPDLNWENPRLRKEIYEMINWWLKKGIDGFRLDAINLISKVEGLPDDPNPQGERFPGSRFYLNGPKVHDYLHEMYREAFSKYDIMTVGEIPGVTPEIGRLYVDEDREELNMIIHFELMDLDCGSGGKWDVVPWKLTDFKKIMYNWYKGLKYKGWVALYLNNHDQPRMVSRFGNDGRYRVQSAKMLATLLHTWQGTPFIYQGEEIGMTNVAFDSIEDYRDIETLNWYNEKVKGGYDPERLMKAIHARSRDNARTPMQWNSGPNAGFTTGIPWIKVNPNYREINVENALKDPDSVFYYYKKLIELRKKHPAIVYGDVNMILEDDENIFAYTRTLDDDKLLVVLNFFENEVEFVLSDEVEFRDYKLLLSNYPVEGDLKRTILKPYEARVYKLF